VHWHYGIKRKVLKTLKNEWVLHLAMYRATRQYLPEAESIFEHLKDQLKVFNSVVLDDPRKTVYKKVVRKLTQAKYILVETAGKFKYDL
jgi:hypothetical protein